MWHSLSAFGVFLYVRFPAGWLFWVSCGFFKFILFRFAERIECVNYVFNKFGEFLAIIQIFFWTTLSFLSFGKSNDINDTNDGLDPLISDLRANEFFQSLALWESKSIISVNLFKLLAHFFVISIPLLSPSSEF